MTVVPLATLIRAYAMRVRRHPMQEALAGAGIAAGVALVFAVSVANSSIASSARDIMQTISGDAQLQLAARGPAGADEDVVERVRAIAGVEVAAPLLEQRATLRTGPDRVGIDLIGVDEQLGELGDVPAPLVSGLLSLNGLFLSAAIGEALHVSTGDQVVLEVRGRSRQTSVTDVLAARMIGALGQATLAGASLDQVQAWTGRDDRVSRVLVRAAPGREQEVRRALTAVADDAGMDVSTLDDEIARLEAAVAPNDQATGLIAAIGVLVGLLLTATAMLLTLPERRLLVAQLRLEGWSGRQIAQRLLFPALVLGVVASLVGLVVGDVLSRWASNEPPGYLAFAFPLGVERTVSPMTIVGAALGGVIVSLIVAAQPLLDLRNDRSSSTYLRGEQPGHTLTTRTRRRLAIVAVAIVAVSATAVLLAPATTVAAVALLAAAALLALPAVFSLLLWTVRKLPRRDRPSMSLIAAQGLRATTVRSLALSATAAIAVFGAIAIEGARGNLLNGLYEDYRDYVSGTDIWITSHGDDLALQPIDVDARRLAAVDGVANVRAYQGGFTDLGDRRVWLIARSPRDAAPIPASQILDGDLAAATDQLRAGGSITVSEHVADEHGVAIGDPLTLRTPSGPRSYDVAAITTNLGWGPGAIILNLDDFRRDWNTTTPTAVQLDAVPGHSIDRVIAHVRDELGPDASAVRVQTVEQRAAHANALAREGLARLSQIATLLVIAAGIAIAAAMTATIWQRRPTFAQRSIEGFTRGQLWRIVFIEAAMIIAAGCIAGALAGAFGHWLLGRWLEEATGYPAPYAADTLQLLASCGAVAAVALVIVAVPGYLAVRAPGRLALDDRG